MSEITSEINKITGSIIGISVKLIVYALVVLFMVEGVSRGYAFGYDVFYASAVSQPPGRDITVKIPEGADTSEVAKELYELGLVKNQYTIMIHKYFYEYQINPGTYVLNTSMTSKQMLDLLNEAPADEEESTSEPVSGDSRS